MKKYIISSTFLTLCLLLVSVSTVVGQGKLISIKGSVRDQSTRGKLDGAVVQLMKGGAQERKVVTPNSGSYEFELQYDNIYTIIYSKGGYITKRLEVNTNEVPEEDKSKGWYKIPVDMTLFEKIEGLDVSILDKPIGKFKYDASKKDFAHDPAYTASIKNKLSELMANYEKRKKEEDEKLKNKAENEKENSLNEKKFKILMSKGDEAFTARDYGKSMDSYQAALALKPNDVLAKNKLDKAKQKENERINKIEEAKKSLKDNDKDKKVTASKSTTPKTTTAPPIETTKDNNKIDYEDFEKQRAREREELKRKREEEQAKKEAEYKARMEARQKELELLEKKRNEGNSNFSSEKDAEREALLLKIEEEKKQQEQDRIAFEQKKKEELISLNKQREEQRKQEREERERKIRELQANSGEKENTGGWDDDLGEKVSKDASQVEVDMKRNLDREQVENYENIQKYSDEITKQKLAREETSKANRMQQYDSIAVKKNNATEFQKDNSEQIRKRAEENEKYRKEIAEIEKSRLDQSKAERELTIEEIRKSKEEREKDEREDREKNKENYKSFEAYKKGLAQSEQEKSLKAKEKRGENLEEVAKAKERERKNANDEAINQNRENYKELDSYKEELAKAEQEKKQSFSDKRSSTSKELEEEKKLYSEKQNNKEAIKKNSEDIYSQQNKMIELEKERDALRKKRTEEFLAKKEEVKEDDSDFEGNELSEKYPEGVTEEVYEQKNEAGVIVKTTIRRIVVKGKHGNEYRKIIAKWGTTYFKDGRAVSETVWTTETSGQKIN